MILATSLFFLFDNSTQKKASTGLAEQHKENRVIIIPDGSTVILSPGSKLNYPSSFDGLEKREVFLYGQAFFDIKHNPKRPFVVHTGRISTIVLGTAFNIRAIPSESEIIVTVKRGKVKVINDKISLGVITPNQQITFNKSKVSSNTKVVDTDSLIRWKDQDLFIDNLTISEVSKLLEERYSVKIIIEHESVGSERFTTTFTQNERLEQILKSICIFNDLVYEFNKEKTSVKINTQKLNYECGKKNDKYL
jgi:transmembrane sensor